MVEPAPLVLIVEDETANRELLAECVRLLGCRTSLAANGQEGLRLAQEQHPDLILLDMKMPVMNGAEMLRALRASAATASIPVILVSSWLDSGQFDTANVGAMSYLDKPFTVRKLFEHIRHYLPNVQMP
ncbi:MAG: response regulator [Deinococcus sp.]|nr:response regulator [Deinococcus sp.]